MEKGLRRLAKQCKDIKYTKGLLLGFLIAGTLSFSNSNVAGTTPEVKNIETSINQERTEIRNSISDINKVFREARKENNKLMKGSNLELVQLMEQGDHVVKSPWSSWQYGANYFFSRQGKPYKGFEDRKKRYPFQGKYARASWMERSTLVTNERSLSEISPFRFTSEGIPYSTNKNLDYGFLPLRDISEPDVELQVLANVNPKSINKQKININQQIETPGTIARPEIQIGVNSPLEAPSIIFPEVTPVSINVQNPANPDTPALATAPTVNISLTKPTVTLNIVPPTLNMAVSAPSSPNIGISIDAPGVPTVNALNVTAPAQVTAPNISFTAVNPVDFTLSASGLSGIGQYNFASFGRNTNYNLNDKTVTVSAQNGFISTWGTISNLNNVNTNVEVNAQDTRAFMIDEGVDGTIRDPFRYIGTINLNNSKNAGIDVQGTHTGYSSSSLNPNFNSMDKVANIKVINAGTINGNGGGTGANTIKNQVAFGFNNFDSSTNNTRNEMINDTQGTITLKAPESAGIQLRPENPNASGNNEKLGLNMMSAENKGTVNLNSFGSFGMLTVKNINATSTKTYSNYGITTTAGGQIASHFNPTFESKMENKGTINISGDKSIGIGLIHNIQGVYAGGNIKIGTENPSSHAYANSGSDTGKVEEAVGVYAEVETRPVKKGELDDFAQMNSTNDIVGTDGINLTGTVTIGKYSQKVSGARVKNKGTITVSGTIDIQTGAEGNYGIVTEGTSYKRRYRKVAATWLEEDKIGRVDITSAGKVNVNGNNSVGYILVQGEGSNAGNITVNAQNALGFYGKTGKFENTGTITSTGAGSNAVVLEKGTDTLIFNNTGNLITNTEGTVALYVKDGATFNHTSGKITAGNGAVGIYSIGTGTTGTIAAPIEVQGSTASKTGIGVYSDGQSVNTFNTGAELLLGNGTVGLFSAKTGKFNNTFVINGLKASLDDNAVLAYFKGDSPTASENEVTISGNSINNLTVTKMGKNSALFYGATGSKVTLGESINLVGNSKFSNISTDAQLLVTKDGTATIGTGKVITSNLKTTISALGTNGGTRGNAENKGTLNLTGTQKAIGIYLSEATGKNSAGATITANEDSSIGIFGKENSVIENSGTVTMKKQKSVGLLAQNSSVTNKNGGTITTEGTGSAGIYGSENSTISNEGTITAEETGSAGIYSDNSNAENKASGVITAEKGTSAGIYAKVKDAKSIQNVGTINVGTAANTTDTQGAGIYGEVVSGGTGVLAIGNTSNINIDLNGSVGIFAKNGTGSAGNLTVSNTGTITAKKENSVGILSEKSTVTSSGTVTLQGKTSVGIFGKNDSEITNSGNINATNSAADSKSVGIISDKGTAVNTGNITMAGGGSAGMLGQNGATLTNSGSVTMNGEKSAGIYTENSTSSNEGTVTVTGKESAGMFAKNSSADNYNITNKGTINLNTVSGTPEKSVGMYAEIATAATGTTTLKNENTITVDQGNSVGMYILNNTADKSKAVVKNDTAGKIETKKASSVGILANKGTVTNLNILNILGSGSAGIYGKNDSLITNSKNINVSETSSAGIYAENSEAANDSNGTVTVSKGSSAGIFGKVDADAAKDYKLINNGTVNLTGGTTYNQSVGMYGELTATAGHKLALENTKNINIGTASSVGMYILNNTGTVANITADNTGTISGSEASSVGILSSKGTVTNDGTISMNGNASAGIFAQNGSEVTNNSVITMNGTGSAGVYTENSNASNAINGKITVTKGSSAGMFGKYSDTGNYTLENSGNISISSSASSNSQSIGMYGQLENTATGSVTLTNNKTVNVDMENSLGMYIKNNTSDKTKLKAVNNDTITGNKNKAVGIFADNAVAENNKTIDIKGAESTGIFGKNGSEVKNTSAGTVTLSDVAGTDSKSAGIYIDGLATKGINEGNILLNGKATTGISATGGANALNSGNITGNNDSVIGIYGNGSTVENTSNGVITLKGNNSTGIFAKNSTVAKNTGTINLETENGSKKSVGMYGITDNTTDTINLSNTGTINLNSEDSVGIFAKNGNSAINNSLISNTGTINLNKKQTVGIFTPKSKITNVGKIVLSDDANSSVAVYLTDLAEADTSTGNIDLNSVSQNQVAYYVKDTGKITGTDIGSIKGYGVGVYLDGGTLDASSPTLDYTATGNSGNGIIGLLLKGNTNISGYTRKIKVGNTAGTNYAITMYADGQGTSGTAKNISAALETGENGVGLFAENGSNINYTGQMSIGNGVKAGTAIYIGNNNGTNPSTVTIGSGANIVLKGENGVGAIVTKNATVNFDTGSVIELQGSGVGLFGQKGAVINDNGGTFNNNGHSAERIRITGGISRTIANTTLTTGNVLTHVINGEAVIETGVTVNSASTSQNVIGLLAEGNRDDNDTTVNWLYKDISNPENNYDTINLGTIDFTNSTSATGMYLESARGKNSGEIKVGDNSTGIYGVYKSGTSKFDGVTPNKSVILNDTGKNVEVGNVSAGIYSVGFEKVENKGSVIGKDKSVGIYAANFRRENGANIVRDISADIINSGDITLGNGSAGIYVKADSSSVNSSNVVNSGNITTGDTIFNASGVAENSSVGIYTEKSNVTSTGNITVGNKGMVLFGSNSTMNINSGNIDYSNDGSLAYMENSTLNYNIGGTLQTYSDPLLFINNSKVTMAQNDINVSDNGVAAYMSGNSEFKNWNKITLGQKSVGIYGNNSSLVSEGTLIEGTLQKSRGIIGVNSNIKNNASIKMAGEESLGIYSGNTSGTLKNIDNSGNIEISGKKTVGIYLEGNSDQTVNNRGNITVHETTEPDRNNSTIGIYAKDGATVNIINEGQVNVGKKSVGIYSTSDGTVTATNTALLNVSDEGIGIYKKGGTVNLGGTVNVADHTSSANDSEPVGVYGIDGVSIVNNANTVNVGNKSYGVILSNPGVNTNRYVNSAGTSITLGEESTYLYSDGNAEIVNNGNITSPNNKIIAIYSKNGGYINNKGNIDLSTGIGNLGIYATGTGSYGVNEGTVKIGGTDNSDKDNIIYGIGMVADRGAKIENRGNIHVSGDLSLGMYGKGAGTELRNSGTIYLDGSSATAANKISTMTGVFIDEGAKFVNEAGGVIKSGSYSGNDNVSGLIGVAVLNGSTLENHGIIDIDADRSYGALIVGTENNKSIIKNYGTITIRGKKSYGVKYRNTIGSNGQALPEREDIRHIGQDAVINMINGSGGSINASDGARPFNSGTDINKAVENTEIVEMHNGKLVVKRNGVVIEDSEMEMLDYEVSPNIGLSNFGIYVDTLGRTKPISLEGITSPDIDSDLIIGTEFTVKTNSKNVILGDKIMKPFLDQTNTGIFNFTPYSASLTWMATPQMNLQTGKIEKIVMAKIPYTAFVPKKDNSFNFADGLEQRYSMNELGTQEKALFDKLNSIGNNEQVLLAQAFDEMMGHQYGNVQQRLNSTGKLLDKEFGYLRKEWENTSKQSNKIKVFGMKDEYKTDTAGIIDYTSNAYGVAYTHENEAVKLGNSSGWYAGAVNNKFKFKDIGGSKEDTTMVKLGVFKTMSPASDHNGSLQWTISGEGYAARSDMHRKYLVVDEIFNAKSSYNSYGVAVKNELSKEFRISERTSIRPYGSLKVEYGSFSTIKEKTGEVRLDIKGNDYYSIKPEAGIEFKYRQPLAVKTMFTATVGLGYENELGKIGDVDNKGRVAFTDAEWFNIRGEKDDRKGNFKADLNLGIENKRVGFTLNGGYDTKGDNLRGGIGIRVIY